MSSASDNLPYDSAERIAAVRKEALTKGDGLSDDRLQSAAFLAKSLSDGNRLKILLLISNGRKSVSAIVEALELSQPLVSHHLKELKRSLMVRVEREGPFVYYELADDRILKALEILSEVAADLLSGRKTFWMEKGWIGRMDKLFEIISRMAPEEALSEITDVLGRLLRDLDPDARERFLMTLIGQSEGDKVSGMVHLWLAECMGEGVDPTQMCQSLVDKVTRSEQLLAIADPDVLALFEDWLDELEAETRTLINAHGPLDEKSLAEKLGLSRKGAAFLLSKTGGSWNNACACNV